MSDKPKIEYESYLKWYENRKIVFPEDLIARPASGRLEINDLKLTRKIPTDYMREWYRGATDIAETTEDEASAIDWDKEVDAKYADRSPTVRMLAQQMTSALKESKGRMIVHTPEGRSYTLHGVTLSNIDEATEEKATEINSDQITMVTVTDIEIEPVDMCWRSISLEPQGEYPLESSGNYHRNGSEIL